jgi:Protein of unknown function (DUF1573)
MRKIFLFVFLFIFPAVSYSQPSITFDAEDHDFGTIVQGDTLEHVFNFKNTGNEDLIVEKVSAS